MHFKKFIFYTCQLKLESIGIRLQLYIMTNQPIMDSSNMAILNITPLEWLGFRSSNSVDIEDLT